jgi:hypothetical protein
LILESYRFLKEVLSHFKTFDNLKYKIITIINLPVLGRELRNTGLTNVVNSSRRKQLLLLLLLSLTKQVYAALTLHTCN